MENKKDEQALPKRHSLRLPGHDYSYDHIIRNDEDLLEKQQYILNNPLKEQEKKRNS